MTYGARGVLLLALAAFFYAAAPPEDGRNADLVLERAESVLRLGEPGDSRPELPGWTTPPGLALAAAFSADHLVSRNESSRLSRWLESEETQRARVRGVWSLLAATVVLLAAVLSQRVSLLFPALVFLLLLMAPGLRLAVAQTSPGVPGALGLLLLTWRLGAAVGSGMTWGLGFGAVLGCVLAWAGGLWPFVVAALLAAAVKRVRAENLIASVVVSLSLAFALEPERLRQPLQLGEVLFTEWFRMGGWSLHSAVTASAGWDVLTLFPVLGWFVLPALLVLAVLAGRRWPSPLLLWFALVFVLGSVLPWASGLRSFDSMQLAVGPSLAVALVLGVSGIQHRLPTWAERILPAALLIGSVGPLLSSGPGPSIDAEAVAKWIDVKVDADALILLERPLPGGAQLEQNHFVLPRDSRAPNRYDFAYWPRWYHGFTHVLLDESLTKRNVGRDLPAHFYGQLRDFGTVVETWGEEGKRLVLVTVPADGEFSRLPSGDELQAVEDPADLGAFLTQLGSTYAEQGQRSAATRIFEIGVRLDPSRVSLQNNLGSIYLLDGEWEAAARVFDNALRIAPNSPELLFNAGRAYSEVGALERAEGFFRRAVAAKPDFTDAHYELARTFLALGRAELARTALERVLELSPSPQRRAQIEEVLLELRGGEGG